MVYLLKGKILYPTLGGLTMLLVVHFSLNSNGNTKSENTNAVAKGGELQGRDAGPDSQNIHNIRVKDQQSTSVNTAQLNNIQSTSSSLSPVSSSLIGYSLSHQPIVRPEERLSRDQCEELLNRELLDVKDYHIQLIAGAPGSGNDWCLLTIRLFTGMKTTGTSPTNLKAREFSEHRKVYFYYKTHYPFQSMNLPVQQYIISHAERFVLTIRNPLDAGFSTYVMSSIHKMHFASRKKYANVTTLFHMNDFIVYDSSGEPTIKVELKEYLERFFRNWKYHHEFYLTKYTGPLKVVLYRNLADDISNFKDILEFFGYNVTETIERRQRFQCVLDNDAYTKQWKRPTVSLLDEAKEIVRKLYKLETVSVISSVEQMYYSKYGKTITIV